MVGGRRGLVHGERSVVAGGSLGRVDGNDSVVAGGQSNTADPGAARGVIAGGVWNEIGGNVDSPTVTGGDSCRAAGEDATVSGGYQRVATGDGDWRAGSLLEDD